MKILFDTSTSATTEVYSEIFRPHAGSVSSSFAIYSSDVDLTVDVQIDMGGDIGFVDYIAGEEVLAGTAHVVVVDVSLNHRLAITPASDSETRIKVMGQSNGAD